MGPDILRSPLARPFAVLVATVSIVACGADDPAADTAASSTTGGSVSSTSAAPSSTSAPTTVMSSGGATSTTASPSTPTTAPGLDDGRHPVFIDSFDQTARTITVDLVEFLVGIEAETAAAQDGVEVTNDYYLRNRNDRLRSLDCDFSTVEVTVVPWGSDAPKDENVPADMNQWVMSFTKGPSDAYRGADGLWWITVVDGEVTMIEEQYLP